MWQFAYHIALDFMHSYSIDEIDLFVTWFRRWYELFLMVFRLWYEMWIADQFAYYVDHGAMTNLLKVNIAFKSEINQRYASIYVLRRITFILGLGDNKEIIKTHDHKCPICE